MQPLRYIRSGLSDLLTLLRIHDRTTTSPPNDPVSATTNPIPLSANPTVENSDYKPPARDQDAQSRKITIATREKTYGVSIIKIFDEIVAYFGECLS